MTTARIDFATALTPGARLVPVILVAGVPRVLTPAGVTPTTVSLTSGTADPLWWPGSGTLTETLPDAKTFDPVRDLLDPREVFEIFERASPLKGDVRVEALTFSLLDTDGAATAMLSGREALTSQLLESAVTATDTAIPLVSTAGFPSSGIAAIGRETFLYSSISSGDLVTSLVTRGRYGSAARAHNAPAEHRPMVTAGGPRHWQSRLATLWLCTLSADGTTLGDPTLIYVGTVGAGVQLKGNLSRWSVPLEHITDTLDRKLDTAPLDLYGYAHYSLRADAHPLLIGGSVNAGEPADSHSLQWTDDANDNSGWHPSVDSFVAAADLERARRVDDRRCRDRCPRKDCWFRHYTLAESEPPKPDPPVVSVNASARCRIPTGSTPAATAPASTARARASQTSSGSASTCAVSSTHGSPATGTRLIVATAAGAPDSASQHAHRPGHSPPPEIAAILPSTIRR